MDDRHVYAALNNETLVALDRETGGIVWTRPARSTAPPTADAGAVYLPSPDAIRALDPTTGEERWSTATPSPVSSPLLAENGWIVGVTRTGEVIALRAADGTVIWRRPLEATTRHPVASSGEGVLYLALDDGRLVALSLESGQLLWTQQLSGTLSEPAAARDRVFVGSVDNFLYAFRRNGTFEWKWRNGGDVIGIAADGEAVYFASLDNVLRAVNRGNGNQLWKKATGTRPTFPPRAFRGTVVLAGITPSVTSFVGASGEQQGTLSTKGELVGPPLLDTDPAPFRVALVTMTREGVVTAYRPRALTFQEAALVPVTALPGRALGRDRLP